MVDAFLAYWRCAWATNSLSGVRNLCVSAERNKVTFEYELDHKTGHRPMMQRRRVGLNVKNIPQRYCIQETHQRYFLHSCCTSRLPWLSGLKRLLLSALASFSKQWKVTGTTSLAKVVVHVSPWKGVSGEAANYYWPTGTGLVAYLVPIFGVLKAGA